MVRPETNKVKQCLISGKANLVHELLHEFPNDLSLRIVGNQEILKKMLNEGGNAA